MGLVGLHDSLDARTFTLGVRDDKVLEPARDFVEVSAGEHAGGIVPDGARPGAPPGQSVGCGPYQRAARPQQ